MKQENSSPTDTHQFPNNWVKICENLLTNKELRKDVSFHFYETMGAFEYMNLDKLSEFTILCHIENYLQYIKGISIHNLSRIDFIQECNDNYDYFKKNESNHF